MPKVGSDAKRVDLHVGERLRGRRAELGLTQDDLGSALRISYQQVQKYETGANRISAGRLFEMAAALNVDVGYFFDGYDHGDRELRMPHGGHNRAAIEMVRNFLEIQDDGLRTAVTALMRALRDCESRRREPDQASSDRS